MLGNPTTRDQVRQLRIFNEFHAQRYTEAGKLLAEIPESELLALPPRARERHDIFRGYLQLLSRLVSPAPAPDTGAPAFRMAKFLNTFTEANKDKAHLNVHLIIISLVDAYLGSSGGHALSPEAIERYVYRYLREDDSQRTKLFLKALLNLYRQGPESGSSGDKYFRELRLLPVNTFRFPDTEIIPYERLWKLLPPALHWIDQRSVVHPSTVPPLPTGVQRCL